MVTCDSCDFVSEVDEMLEDVREIALAERDMFTLRALRRIRRNPILKNRLLDKIEEKTRLDFAASGAVGEWGDGEFAKWLLDWFIENWPTLLEIIKTLIAFI